MKLHAHIIKQAAPLFDVQAERIFEAIVSVEVEDRQGDVVDIDGLDKAIDVWFLRNAPIIERHTNRPCGQGLEKKRITYKGFPAILIKAQIFSGEKGHVNDDRVWADIQSDKLKMMSIGGEATLQEEICDANRCFNKIREIDLSEISVVEDGANQLSDIIAKSKTLTQLAIIRKDWAGIETMTKAKKVEDVPPEEEEEIEKVEEEDEEDEEKKENTLDVPPQKPTGTVTGDTTVAGDAIKDNTLDVPATKPTGSVTGDSSSPGDALKADDEDEDEDEDEKKKKAKDKEEGNRPIKPPLGEEGEVTGDDGKEEDAVKRAKIAVDLEITPRITYDQLAKMNKSLAELEPPSDEGVPEVVKTTAETVEKSDCGCSGRVQTLEKQLLEQNLVNKGILENLQMMNKHLRPMIKQKIPTPKSTGQPLASTPRPEIDAIQKVPVQTLNQTNKLTETLMTPEENAQFLKIKGIAAKNQFLDQLIARNRLGA